MTSMPASRSARAMILAPRSCPSSPGLAINTRIFFALMICVPGFSVLSASLGVLCVSSCLLLFIPENEATNTVLQSGDIEIDRQPQRASGEPQIGQYDGFVNRRQGLNGLQLHDDAPLDEQVNSVTALQLHVLVHDRNRLLALKSKAPQEQLTR